MKKAFVQTSNVKSFLLAMDRLRNRQEGIPGMALLYGPPGLGKTRCCLKWCSQHGDVFLRIKKLMTGGWLFEELVAELGEAPMRRTSDLFRQVVDQLTERPRILFFDEADYLAHDARVIETLRDIYDITGVPIVLTGMEFADKKLSRYKHLFDRFSEVIRFHELGREDVRTIADELCEVRLHDDAVSFIHNQTNRFRRVVIWLYKAEAIARSNSLKEIKAQHLSGGKP